MSKDDLKELCFDSYLKGQEDILEMLIESTKKYKEATGQTDLKIDEILLVFNNWLERVKSKYK